MTNIEPMSFSVPAAADLVGLSRYMINFWISKEIVKPKKTDKIGLKRVIHKLSLLNLVQLTVLKNLSFYFGGEAQKINQHIVNDGVFLEAFRKRKKFVFQISEFLPNKKIKLQAIEHGHMPPGNQKITADSFMDIEKFEQSGRGKPFTHVLIINIPGIIHELTHSYDLIK